MCNFRQHRSYKGIVRELSNNYSKLILYSENSKFSHSFFFFKFGDSIQFWVVFKYLRFHVKYFRSIRRRFFNGDYKRSVSFLKFCVLCTPDFELILDAVNYFIEDNNDVVSRLQFFFLISKYLGPNLNKPLNNIGWDDCEFDWLVSALVQINHDKVLRWTLPHSKISRIRWWEGVSPSFILCYTGSSKGLYKSIIKLGFDPSRKFNFTQSEFRIWLSGVAPFSNNVSINKRFLVSFQAQFNYSDFSVFLSYMARFRYIHHYKPILPEMYDLPFLNPLLRPGFANYNEMRFMGRTKTLHFAGVYHLTADRFDRFVFDRYLYDHARLMISLPYSYTMLAEAKYTINFGSVIRSPSFFCYFNYFGHKFGLKTIEFVVEDFQTFKFVSPFPTGVGSYEVLKYGFRSRFINRIIVNVWNFLTYFQKYFESVNFFYSTVGFEYQYDWSYTFFGHSKPENFDRVTRRLLIEFSKFLHSKSKFELSIILKFFEDLQILVGDAIGGWGLSEFEYSNMLTEFEAGYRNRLTNRFSTQNNFDTWFFDSVEQFLDYELWLYNVFNVFNKFLDDVTI